MTEWRKIPGLPDRFEASEDGRIRSLPYEVTYVRNGTRSVRPIAGKELKSRCHEGGKSKGQPVVSISGLTKHGTTIGEQRVSLLIARAFHGTPYEPGDLTNAQKWRVMHKDGDVQNVRADNLEWIGSNGHVVTSLYEQNMRYLERDTPDAWFKRIFGDDAELEGVSA